MAILENEIEVSLRGISANYYRGLGYVIPKKLSKTGKEVIDYNKRLLIETKDLGKGSTIKLTKICDICGKKIKNQRYDGIVASRINGDGKDRCFECGRKKAGDSNHTRCLYEESLGHYCKTHSLEFLLEDFIDNNIISPNKISKGSGRKYKFKCPRCSNLKETEPKTLLSRGFSCSRCGDGISYPEKIMFNLLEQLGISFATQKKFSWADGKLYDFFLPSFNIVIETHGLQHYSGWGTIGNIEKIQENDRIKESLAKNNGIRLYVVIDCRESSLEWMKNSIVNSELSNLFNLTNIDWFKCHEYSCNSLIKLSCDIWNEGIRSANEIGKILGFSSATISKYLKKGYVIGWCDYDPREAKRDSGKKAGIRKRKPVTQFTMDGEYLRDWDSMVEVEKELGIHNSKIASVCKGKRKSTGGFKWVYKEEMR